MFGPVLAASPSNQPISAAAARELLSGVCDTGGESGTCTPCPDFTTDATNGLGAGLRPTSVIYGKFTDPKHTDALVDMSGCEPYENNYGVSLRLRWQGRTAWELVNYFQGFRSSHCLKYPAQGGRELLLCQGDYVVRYTLVHSLALFDLKQPKVQTQLLLRVFDSANNCLPSGGRQSLLSWRSLPGGRYPGLQITLMSAAYTRAGQTQADPCGGTLTTTPSRAYTLDYTYDGAKFRPTPATSRALAALQRDNPDLLGE
ncbi:hypothetical protein [Deinococcus sp.]|uniref:hypothetical protein n=1 Tax=Deinococcus sp. TaxID=47478 RepID=UPI0025D83636|nr:hypothetical protein [Deinococcus sp.]